MSLGSKFLRHVSRYDDHIASLVLSPHAIDDLQSFEAEGSRELDVGDYVCEVETLTDQIGRLHVTADDDVAPTTLQTDGQCHADLQIIVNDENPLRRRGEWLRVRHPFHLQVVTGKGKVSPGGKLRGLARRQVPAFLQRVRRPAAPLPPLSRSRCGYSR